MKEKSFTIEQFIEAYQKAAVSKVAESLKQTKDIEVGIAMTMLSVILIKKTEEILLGEEEKQKNRQTKVTGTHN